MGTPVTLKHLTHSLPVKHEYFYDGLVIARDGFISIDSDNINHLRAAYFRGYQQTPKGKWLSGFEELDRYVSIVTAKSAREHDEQESPDSRRQPVN